MKRELSAKLTFLASIVLPALFLFCWSMFILGSLVGDGRTTPPPILVISMGIAVTAALYFTVMKYRKVSVDDQFLHVSNYLKEIKIPLSDIIDVTEIVWLRGHPVTIHLKQQTEFGRKITFIPRSQGLKFFRPHPVVPELKQMAGI